MMPEYEASLARLSVTELGARIASGQLTSEAVVAACLKRIEERESTVGAWESLHADEAVAQAQTRDRESPRGPLHGVPIGIKDIIDTADMPTKYGSTIFATHQPDLDLGVVCFDGHASFDIVYEDRTVAGLDGDVGPHVFYGNFGMGTFDGEALADFDRSDMRRAIA